MPFGTWGVAFGGEIREYVGLYRGGDENASRRRPFLKTFWKAKNYPQIYTDLHR
jgi:hypothetical protein